jgi:hypothetical protein
MLWLQRPKTVRKIKAECHPEARSSVILNVVKDLAVSEMERSFTTFRMTKKNVIHSNDKWGF